MAVTLHLKQRGSAAPFPVSGLPLLAHLALAPALALALSTPFPTFALLHLCTFAHGIHMALPSLPAHLRARRDFLRQVALGAAMLAVPGAFAEPLTRTP